MKGLILGSSMNTWLVET
uniref:Serine/threonine-protein kinase-transforming protein raf n=1 Tax=Rhizophora mucronata TaxID=61149 RepID=A0A2P2MWY2_RHIMU